MVPSPFAAWQVKNVPQLSEGAYEAAETKVTLHALSSFRHSVAPGEELLVLDWLHPCYRFDVDIRHGIRTAFRDEWAVPIVSYGENTLWLTDDFRFGLFALRDGYFAVFGEPLVSAFLPQFPNQELLRDDNRIGNWRPPWDF
ncbi:MAG: DUF2716 domain-containing protein [Planctomycetales bacterium]